MLQHIGLRRPYRFERALPALLSVLGLAIVLVVGLVLNASGSLTPGAPRSFYFFYVIALLIAVIVLAPWPRLSGVLVLLALLELMLGLGGPLNGPASLLPENFDTSGRFRWHALLQATPVPSLAVAMHDGKPLRHSAEGTRGRDRRPQELAAKTVIAVFGGSSTYDVGLGEGETWVDRLEQALGADRFAAINHGVPGYSTVEHLIQTAFYQVKFGAPPSCAVYYVGWNDLQGAHMKNLDPGYADYHLPAVVDVLRTRRIGGAHVYFSPVLTSVARIVSAEIDTVRYSSSIAGEAKSGTDPVLEALYARNVRSISSINRARGIKTVWVGQLLNRAQLTGDGMYGWIPYVRDRDLWALQVRFNEVLRDTARALDDTFVAAPIDSFGDADFVDQGHFSAPGALKFSGLVAPAIGEACRR